MTTLATRPAPVHVQPPRLARQRVPRGWLLACIGVLLVAVAAGITIGPVPLSPFVVLNELLSHLPFVHTHSVPAAEAAIVWQIRVPRVLLAAIVGGTLAIAGASYQGVFANPLADPYLLGTAAGAELGATIAIAYAPHGLGVNAVPVAAFLGATVAVVGAVLLGRSAGKGRSTTVLILAGVAIAAFLTAIQTFIQQQQSDSFREIYSFILGRLSTAGWNGVRLVLPYAAIAAIVMMLHRRHLDVLSLGDDEAASLGVNVPRTRWVLVAAATVGTAAVVAIAGPIAFVGIIIPHTIRLMTGRGYRTIVPLSILLGAAFLILADLLARTLIAPGELSIGVITAFIGAPFFIVLLRTNKSVS